MTRLRCAAGFLLGFLEAILVAPVLAGQLRAVCIVDRALLAAGERAVVTAVTDEERHPEGPAAMSMLVKFIEAHEARQAARGAEGQVGGRLPG
jgi:hypothetical protein